MGGEFRGEKMEEEDEGGRDGQVRRRADAEDGECRTAAEECKGERSGSDGAEGASRRGEAGLPMAVREPV